MKYTLLILFTFFLAGIRLSALSAVHISDTISYEVILSVEAETPSEAELSQIISERYNRYSRDSYPFQIGAFRLRYNAEALFRIARKHIDSEAVIIHEDGFYKVRVTKLPDVLVTAQEVRDADQIAIQGEPVEALHTGDSIQGTQIAGDTLTIQQPEEADSVELMVKAEAAARDILFIRGDSPWLRRITYLGKSIALVKALIITITICLVTMVLLLIVILLNRTRMEREERLKQYLMEKYQTLIIDYLFGETTPQDFKAIASNTFRRQLLINQMIDVSINLKGDDAKKLLGLYKHLGLDRESIARATDYRWHKKIKGFRELAFMNIKDANPAIYKAINSSNEILRMEAQIALVRLSDENPFEFLSHLTRPFSLWEQITLHELLIQHELPVPEFRQWLTSPNPTVVMFALRMIREFKQKDAEDGVREVFSHPSPEVRQLAVQVAGDLDMRTTLEPMKKMYKDQEYQVCLEIVRAMGRMPDVSMMGFLKLVLDKEDDVQLQIDAVKAIENMGEEGVKALVKLMKSEYKNYNIIVRHVLDRRIY